MKCQLLQMKKKRDCTILQLLLFTLTCIAYNVNHIKKNMKRLIDQIIDLD